MSIISKINGHSWVRCTDYSAIITGADYDESKCNGWIRDWTFDDTPFGVDRGINFQRKLGNAQQPICAQNSLNGVANDDYAADYKNKIAQYTSGSTVRVVWPAKNHANYECFNHIPDTSMKLFMNPNVNPTSDLPNTQNTMESNGFTLVEDWQEGCTVGTIGCASQSFLQNMFTMFIVC